VVAYLTPSQLKTMNLGVDLSGYSDVQLASYIARASAAVNSETNAPDLPVPHDFKGGSIVGETHTWPIDAYDRSPTRRVFPYHRPVIEVTTMRIYATKTQYVEFSASELYYEASEGWIEPASANLTSYGLWGAAMYPAIGLSDPHSLIDYTYGTTYPISERIYPDTVTNQWRASAGFWTSDPVVVRVNGVTRASDYTVDTTEGTVLFTAPLPDVDDDTVELDYVTTLHPNIALATGIIAADRISSRNLVAAGFPAGVRAFTVAEVRVERDLPRRGGQETVQSSVPPEAAELLADFKFYPLAFA